MADRRANRSGLWLTIILVVAFAVRVVGLDYSLWYDEIAATQFANTPIALLWSDWMIRETNPPLYYSLLEGWTYLFGGGDVAVRMLSVAIGLAGVALIYFLGAVLFEGRVGLAAAALTAVSAQHIFYSQQVRTYALTFTATVAVMLAAVLLRRAILAGRSIGQSWPAIVFFVFANAVALYAHTILVLLTFLTNAWLLAAVLGDRKNLVTALKIFVVANLAILLIWSWWGRMTWLQLNAPQTNVSWIAKPSVPYAIRMTLEALTPWNLGLARFVAAALAVLAAAVAIVKWPRASSLPLTLLIGAPALLFVISLKSPVFLPRTVFWASAAFTLLVAAGLCAPGSRKVRAALVAVAIAVSAANTFVWWPSRQTEPWRQIVADVQAIDPRALVFVEGRGAALALQRYCERPACDLTIASIKSENDERWVSAFAPHLEVDKTQAEALLKARNKAVFVDWLGLQPEKFLGSATIVERPISVPGLPDSMKINLVSAR